MEKIMNGAGEVVGYRCPIELLPDGVEQGPLGTCAAVATSLCISCTIALDRGENNCVLVPSIQEPVNTIQFQFPRLCRRPAAEPPTAEPPIAEQPLYMAFGGNMPDDVYDPADLKEGGFLDTKLEVVFRYIQYFGVGLESHQPYVGYMNNTKIQASSSRIWIGDYTVVAPRILKPEGRGFKYVDIQDPLFDIRTILQRQPVVGVLRVDPSFHSHKTGIYEGGDGVKDEDKDSHAILIYGYYTEEGQNICEVFNSQYDWGDRGLGEIYMDLFYKFVFPDPHGIWLEVRQEEEEEEEEEEAAAAAAGGGEGADGGEGEGADGGGADRGEELDDLLHM